MSNILLKNLVDGPITPQMIVYVTQKATSVIPCDSMLSSLSSSSSSSTLSNSNSNHINNKSNNKNNNNNNKNNNNKNLNQSSSASSLSINTDNNHVHHIHHDEDLQLLPPLQNFIQRLVTRSSVSTATFLTTIIYLDRLKKKLPKLARGMHCTRHRVFLAILIVASKYLNDSSPRNKYWARFSSVYSVNKVNLMERQLLTLLDYDLRVTEAELLLHLSPFLKSPSSLSTSYNNNSTGNTLIDTLKLPYPINSNLNNNGNLDNLDNHTINNSNEYIQRTCSYPQISIPKSLPLSMYDNDNNMNTINNNNNNVFSSPSSYQPLIVDNNNNYNYNDDNDDAMNTDEDDEFSSSNTNNVNTVINDNSFSNFSQNTDQHQTKDQFGRRLSSTSTCSSSSTSSITTPTSVPTAFQNNSNNLLLQQQLNHLQLLQLQLNLFNKQPDIPSIPSIITPTSTNYLQSQHQLNQNSHNHHHHHHYQQQSSFQPPPLKSLLSDAGADNYFGSSDFNNNNHNQIHHSHYNYNLPILNVNNHNNNNNFHQHYNHIILPNPVNTTTTTNVSYME